MRLPFTAEQFFEVFRAYNSAVFPAQFSFYLLAFAAILFGIKKYKWSDKAIGVILAFFWIWMGIMYHIQFFSSINKAAYFFGILFIVQGFLLCQFFFSHKTRPGFHIPAMRYLGMTLIIFSLFIYPAIGYYSGHRYPFSPTFGLPCPTTIFTFGILLFIEKRTPFYLLVIPLLWSAIGTAAAFSLSVKEDIGLLVSGLITLAFRFLKTNNS